VLKQRLSYWLGHYWIEFDYVYMKPKLIYNWPGVKDDNDNIAKTIREAIHQYTSRKSHLGISTNEFFSTDKEKHDDHGVKGTHMDSPGPDTKKSNDSLFNNLTVFEKK
jgi:hypothetical protein